jgi:hypothetical protein
VGGAAAAEAAAQAARVFIVNARGGNSFTFGRYLGCLTGRHATCYLLDDDFFPSFPAALWAAYQAAPDRLHVVTDTPSALFNTAWSVFDAAIGLHAGFAWLRNGRTGPTRRRGALCVDQLPAVFPSGGGAEVEAARDARRHADLYFSLLDQPRARGAARAPRGAGGGDAWPHAGPGALLRQLQQRTAGKCAAHARRP